MAKVASDSLSSGDGPFDKTHWTAILAAGDPSSPGYGKACEQFCLAYWKPLYWFVLKQGHSREKAQDLTQDFFAWLLEKKVLGRVSRDGGRFRSFLLTVLKHFLINELEKWRALKRGGGNLPIPFDEIAEASCQKELADPETPETLYDRNWAWALVRHVFERVRLENQTPEKKKLLFDCIQGCLPGAAKELLRSSRVGWARVL